VTRPRTWADPIDAAVREALQRTGTPGAVVRVVHRGRTVTSGAWGAARIRDERGRPCTPAPLRLDTLFDVASITKVVSVTAITLSLVGARQLDLDQPVTTFLPAFRGDLRDHVTLRHLLAHRSGLPDWAPLFLRARDPEAATAALCVIPLMAEPDATYRYSDLGMMVLGRCLERVAQAPLATLARELVFEPLGMTATGYGPRTSEASRCAATSFGNPVEARMAAEREGDEVDRESWWRHRTLAGEVNDANAAIAFGGVAGHAGVFSTAEDLGRFGAALLRAAAGQTDAPWQPGVVRRFLAPGPEPTQGLGFWTRRITSVVGTNAGVDPLQDTSVGHRGFTGCELLVDPARDLVVVLLSNRLHGGDPPPEHTPLWLGVLSAVLHATDEVPGP
jgi:CubicO group peptidase (beta-lactamase class C family)